MIAGGQLHVNSGDDPRQTSKRQWKHDQADYSLSSPETLYERCSRCHISSIITPDASSGCMNVTSDPFPAP